MFEVGDKIVCTIIGGTSIRTDDNLSLQKYPNVFEKLILNNTYVISGINNNHFELEGIVGTWYIRKWFVSEREFLISNRIEKINKLKQCLK